MTNILVGRNTKIGLFVSFITCLIFGMYPAASQMAYADGANATFVLFATTFIRTVSLSGFCLWTRKPLFQDKEDRKLALKGGLFQAMSLIGIICGLVFIPGPVLLIIVFTHTMLLFFLLVWKGEAKMEKRTLLPTLSAFIGLTFVLDLWNISSVSSLIGMGFAFMAAFATVFRLYLFGNRMKDKNPAVVGAETFIVAFLFVLPLWFWQSPVPPQSMGGIGWTLLSALSLTLGTFGIFYGIALLGSFRWSLFAKVEPVFTALFSILFMGAYLKTSQYIGMAIVIGSLVTYQLAAQQKTSWIQRFFKKDLPAAGEDVF